MKLAIFDFNGTIFPKETLPFLLTQWYKQNYSRKRLFEVSLELLPLFVKYKLFSNTNDKEGMEVRAVRRFSNIFSGMNMEELSNFFTQAAENASGFYNKQVLKEVSHAKENGYHTVLLSGAFKLFVERVGSDLDIDTVIGSELIFNNGIFKECVNVISGSKKLGSLLEVFNKNQIDWSNSIAYADSYHDLQLLESVGNPVPVNPDDKLIKTAQKNNWRII